MAKRKTDREVIGNAAAAEHISKISGRPITASTWKAYVARKKAPKPHRRQETDSGHALPVWLESTLDAWHRGRPGQGWAAGTKRKQPETQEADPGSSDRPIRKRTAQR